MGDVKGSAIVSRVRFIRDRYGEPRWRQLRDSLPEPHQDRLKAGVLPHAWVPFSLFIDLNVEADRELGVGDLALCREMGRYGASLNLPTLYRIFFKLGSFGFLLGKAKKLWSLHYSSGKLEVTVDKGYAELEVRDFDQPHAAHCASVLGWTEAAAEMSGTALRGSDERLCRTRGDEVCRFVLDW